MKVPDVLTVLTDTRSEVRYEVYAYRELTQTEMVFAIKTYLASVKKKPKKGTCVTIHSIIDNDTHF
jgi:hypothetical protein